MNKICGPMELVRMEIYCTHYGIWAEGQLFLDPASKHPISKTRLNVLIVCMKLKGEASTMKP